MLCAISLQYPSAGRFDDQKMRWLYVRKYIFWPRDVTIILTMEQITYYSFVLRSPSNSETGGVLCVGELHALTFCIEVELFVKLAQL